MTDDEAKETAADFVQQNAMMATIYRNSYFTISAGMSTSMTSGIFCARSYESHRLQAVDDDGNTVSFHIRQPTFHSTTTNLETRAWALQEYVLPARVLSFGEFDISWRCQQEHTCECNASDRPNNDHWRRTLGTSCRPWTPDYGFVQAWWEQMIYFYSNRKLTNEQDKLPALSGLAQIYNETTRENDTYLAGVWQTFLHHGLCWYHVIQEPGSYIVLKEVPYPMGVGIGRRPRGFRAPSWSWASLDACDDTFCCPWWPGAKGIRDAGYQYSPRIKACTIYEAVCKPKTKDAFGEVEPGAFITIGAKLIAATITAAPEVDAESGLGMSGQRPVRGILPWTLSQTGNDRELIICFPDCRLEDDGLELGDSVYCAPILEGFTEVESQIGCLVLRVVQGHQYRRVGYCILGKKNPEFAQYTRKELDDLEGDWVSRNIILSEAQEEGRIIDYSLHYSREPETRITIL